MTIKNVYLSIVSANPMRNMSSHSWELRSAELGKKGSRKFETLEKMVMMMMIVVMMNMIITKNESKKMETHESSKNSLIHTLGITSTISM